MLSHNIQHIIIQKGGFSRTNFHTWCGRKEINDNSVMSPFWNRAEAKKYHIIHKKDVRECHRRSDVYTFDLAQMLSLMDKEAQPFNN